jgi:NADH:ubiquinone oxidoreductase subunit E
MSIDISPVNNIVKKWEIRKDFLIEILQDVQDEYTYLPREVLVEISKILDIPLNQVYEVATYYRAFSLKPKGKHPIQVCLGTACHVRGAKLVFDSLVRELNIKEGETTDDKQFSLDVARCLGCCGIAPVITVGKDVFGKVSQSKVPVILKKYEK